MELDRYRRGLGENIVASTSSANTATTEDKELEDITNSLTIESFSNKRGSDRTRGAKEVNVRGSLFIFLSFFLPMLDQVSHSFIRVGGWSG